LKKEVEESMNLKELKKTEYAKCVDLLAKLTNLDAGEKEIIHKAFEEMGIKSFFLHLDSVEMAPETIDKLESIKAIVEMSDARRGRL
jgi:hypothetical protein